MHAVGCMCAPGCRARTEAVAEVKRQRKLDEERRSGDYPETPIMRTVRELAMSRHW